MPDRFREVVETADTWFLLACVAGGIRERASARRRSRHKAREGFHSTGLFTNPLTASPLSFTASLPKQKLSRAKSRQLRRLGFYWKTISCKIQTKPHPEPEWHNFCIRTSEDIDDVNSPFFALPCCALTAIERRILFLPLENKTHTFRTGIPFYFRSKYVTTF